MRLFVTVVCLAWAAVAHAQQVIYDAKRDATAQQAAAAARQITSGTLFETMLRNVDAQAKLEADTEMAFVEQRMRAKLQNFITWHDTSATLPTPLPAGRFLPGNCHGSLRCELQGLELRLAESLKSPPITPEALAARQKAIDERQRELRAALAALQAANQSKDPLVIRTFALLEDQGQDAVDLAQTLVRLAGGPDDPVTKGVSKALDELEKGLQQAIALYHAVEGIWRGYKAIGVEPASLRPPQEQIDLLLLAAEQDHLSMLARIEARKQIEVGAALARIRGALGQLQTLGLFESTTPIEATLRDAAKRPERDRAYQVVRTLHEAAAVIAQVDASDALARFRVVDEARRYSIRRSAINTSTYDQAIQAAVQRLTLYWKGGLKPADIAQLAFYITNTIAIPAIAIKQE